MTGLNFKTDDRFAFGVSSDGGRFLDNLDTIKHRNKLWQNEHFASLHAAMGLSSASLDPGKALGSHHAYKAPSQEDVDAAYWYAGYEARLAIVGDPSKVRTTVSKENQARIAKYEEKYKDYWFWQRKNQICADIKALKGDPGFTANVTNSESTPAEKAPAGEIDAR